MSKAGCGDVLTGVIAAMLALRLEPFSAAAMGVYIHGLAGEKAITGINEHSLMASDLIYFLMN
jgi:NAD(P)H-hydrate epimerase